MDLTDPNYNAALASVIEQDQPLEQTGDEKQRSNVDLVHDEIKSMILKRKEASRVTRQPKKEKWDKCWDHYKEIYDSTNKASWQSTTFIPASPKVAEVITANLHSAALGPERPLEYQARQPEFEAIVRDINDLIAVDFERASAKIHVNDIIRTMCIMGTGIGKVEYRKEMATVKIKERVKPNPIAEAFRRMTGLAAAPTEITTEKTMLVKDYAQITNRDPYNIYPEPGSEEIDKDHWIIEEGKICNYKLIELTKDQDNPIHSVTDDLLMNNPSDPGESPDTIQKDIALDEPTKQTAYMDPDQEHTLDEYWGPAPIWMVQPELYGDESRKYESVHAWLWLIDGQWVVRNQITPFRDAEPPYVKGVYIRVPGQFWGMGPLELMLGLQIELNELRNTRQDNVNIMLNKVMAVIKSAIASGEYSRLVSGPGAIWMFDNIDDIKKALMPIDFPDVTQDSWRSSQEVYNEIQEVTAATKETIGTGGADSQAGGGTFRGQLLNKQAAADRFIMYARNFETTCLTPAFRKFYQRIYQFKGWDEAEKILGQERAKDFRFVAPEELDTMAKLVPLGVTTMENKGVKLAQMADQFKMFSGQPWFKPIDHARRMMVVGGDDPDISIMTDQEVQIFNQAKRAMLSQDGMGMGGPMGGGPQDMQPSSPIAGDVPGPSDGTSQPPAPPRGPGASPIDGFGLPAA